LPSSASILAAIRIGVSIDPTGGARLMRARLLGIAAILVTLFPALARAHPHVWVAVRSEVVFTPDGRIRGVRHAWTFDEMYSAFALQGLGKDGRPPTREELAPLAKINAESLAEFDYFTFARYDNAKASFGPPEDIFLEADDKKIVTMHFVLPLESPVSAHKPFSFQVYDPTYFVAFDFDKQNPIALAAAPSGCSTSLVQPKPLLATESQKLSEAFFSKMSPGADFGIKLATRVVVACP
jgi:ABC-type uncharacterized transport system substrate-binding protein